MFKIGEEGRCDDLNNRLNYLQYEQIEPLKKEISDIKINIAENSLLTKQCTETSSKLSDTMICLKESLIQMAESMKVNNKVSEELAGNVKMLSKQVVTLDEKVEDKFAEVDNKSKVDILQWLKNNWFAIVGDVAIIGYMISKITK